MKGERDGRICATALGLLAGLSGCSGDVMPAVEASATTTLGYVAFDRTQPAGQIEQADAAEAGTPSAARTSASAFFLRLSVAADERVASRLVGAGLTLPEPGTCVKVEPSRDEGLKLASLGPVDLVDVGEVSVESGQAQTTLAARAFPDLMDLISGVVYASRAGTSLPAPESAYRVRVSGSASLPALLLAASTPAPVTDLGVGGTPADGTPIVLPRGDLLLTWQPMGTDPMYLELSSSDTGSVERVRCAFGDEGHALVKKDDLPRGDTQSLSIHRLRREPLGPLGLDGGEIRFDEAVTTNLRFEVQGP
jgi:hypothetical protein